MASQRLIRAFRFLAVLSSVLLSALLVGPTVQAQGFFRPPQGASSGRFIEAPRRIQQQIREAERALEEGRESDAVVRLGDLLSTENTGDDSDLSGQDFFMEINDSRDSGVPVTKSLMRTARDRIGRMPAAALETYELRYGPLARRMLTEAAAERNWMKVREVRRRYFHTLAGYEASALLAQHELFQGHPLAASLLLDDVVTVDRALNHLGGSTRLMYAAAMNLAGRDVHSLEIPVGDTVVVGGESYEWPQPGELSQWLNQRFNRLSEFAGAEVKEYPVFGSSTSRNGGSAGQMPLMNLRWMLNTTASPRQERSVRQAADDLATSGKLPPPSWVPLRVGEQLLMRTTERLVGVDHRTGKRVWTYPWYSAFEFFDEESEAFDPAGGDSGPSELLSQRVWNDVPYGQITTDGERVYVLDDLREVEMAPLSAMMLRGTRPADTRTNTLVALDLATEGKLRWRLGTGSDETSALSDAFFLGPPLPLDGRLYVMVELAGDINLCCLDPETGNEVWRQQLVAVESGGIEADPIRRVAGAMPTYHEGVLICPTGAGAIVAIDLGDRTMRWGINYERNMEMARSISGRSRGLEVGQLMQRWFSGVAVAGENAVVVTPVESDRLFGFNLITGERLFAEKPRSYMRYLAGIRNGRFVVVGTNKIQAFDLESGASLWETPRDLLSAGQQISGLGVFGENEYFVPTTSNQIVRISLDDGTVTGRRTTRYPLGNLVAVDGEIIAQGTTTLAVAFGEATLEPLVDRMLKQNPNDFEAMVRKSELLIQKGKRAEALAMLSRAREMQPDNDEVRMLSVTAMLGTLRESDDVDPNLISTLDDLIDRPSQRAELLSLRVRMALTKEDYVAAAERLFDLSSLIVREPLLESSSDQVINDPARQCSLDAWVSARIGEIVMAADEDSINEINERLQELNEPRIQASTNLLKRVVRHFDALDGIGPLREELGQRFETDNRSLELERLALSTSIPTSLGVSRLSNDRLAMLATAYAQGGLPEDAAFVLDALESREDSDHTELIDEIRASTQIQKPQWADSVSLKWDSRRGRIPNLSMRQKIAETNLLAGKTFAGWRLVTETTSPLSLRDRTGLLRRVPMELLPVKDIDKEALTCGGVMVVVMPGGLLGLDLYHVLLGDGESILWRRGLSGDSGPIAKRRSKAVPFGDQKYVYTIDSSDVANPPEFKLGPVMGDRVLVLQGGDLLAIDLISAETLWRNSDAPKSGVVLSDGRRVAVVSNAMQQEVAYFDLLDGRKLESRDWDHGTTWATGGQHILSYRLLDDGRYEIKLVNPFSDEVVLSHTSEGSNKANSGEGVPRAFGRVVGGRYLAMLHNSGQAIIWDLVEGLEIGRPELPAYDDLQRLHVIALEGQLVLMPERRTTRSRNPQGPQLQASESPMHQPAHAAHAISLDDGTLRWSQEFEQRWGCTLTQPAETPILLFSRSVSVYSATSRRKTIDVLALDVRDGKVLHQETEKAVLPGNNELHTRLTVQGGLSRVIAQMGGELLTYKFGNEPDPE